MRRPTPYRVLPPGADLDAAAREVAEHGWRVHRGFSPPEAPWDLAPARIVVVGVVDRPPAAEAALLCAVRGAGLVAVVDRDRPWAASFLAELARLAPPRPPPAPPQGPSATRPGARPPAAGASVAWSAGPPAAAGGSAAPARRQVDATAPGPLTAEQRDLLDLLAEGHSIAQAARLRYLSLRTANRRVAEARAVLGVTTTREAVLAYVRLRGR